MLRVGSLEIPWFVLAIGALVLGGGVFGGVRVSRALLAKRATR